ncbi:MAG: hypothetical protein AAF937_04080 [Planctomycetota bacterium]
METSELIRGVSRAAAITGSAVLAGASSGQIAFTPVGVPDGLLDADGDLVPIDLNGNGTSDFDVLYTEPAAGNLNIKIEGTPFDGAGNVTDEILVDSTAPIGEASNPLALGFGEVIGPDETPERAWQFVGQTGTGNSPSGVSNTNGGGNFRTVGAEEFIGIRTIIDGNLHYGWIGIEITELSEGPTSADDRLTGVVTGFAYETTPDLAILAGAIPAPGTAAVLALGAVASASRKRREA